MKQSLILIAITLMLRAKKHEILRLMTCISLNITNIDNVYLFTYLSHRNITLRICGYKNGNTKRNKRKFVCTAEMLCN